MREKQAILVVSFGTSHHDTCRRNITAIEEEIAGAFPGWQVRRAFTSGMIIRKLKTRDNIEVDTVTEAMEKLLRENVSQVVVQPTHIMNGEEYDDIVADLVPFRDRLAIRMGAPLLTQAADYRALAGALAAKYPPAQGRAYCLMGHGTTHFADAAYAALDYHFDDIGRPDIFVGTVEGFPDLDTLRRHVGAHSPRRITLAPLMVVAGDHAVNDMAGDGEDSWRTVLQGDGYEVDCVLEGLGESPAVRGMYVEHTRAAIG